MAAINWNGASGDWTNAAAWAGGVAPKPTDTAVFTGASAYTVTLYSAAAIAGLTMNAPGALFYDAGLLALGGVLNLQAGTFALAYGTLQGGTLALNGGILQASGGTLDNVAVQGTLSLAQANATLFVKDSLTMAGAGGTGSGTLAINGSYASLNFLGTQILANAVVTLGATGIGGAAGIAVSHAWGATTGATLTLGAADWVQETGIQGQIIVGAGLPSALTDTVINRGTITAATAGSTLTLGGTGTFLNAGTIGISNGATLDIATGGFTNSGTIVVSNATLDFGGTFSAGLLSSLGALSLTAATVEIGGDALNGGILVVGSGTQLGPILLAGTITGGKLADTGSGLNLSAGTGVLDGVTYAGSLVLVQGAELTLADNTALIYQGNPGTAAIQGAGAALLLEGQSTPQTALNNATLSIGSSSGVAELGTADTWLSSAATTATLGPRLLIQQTGKFAAIDANATTPIRGYGLTDTLVNQGTVNAGYAGGTLTLGGAGLFINQGVITASNGDTLAIDALAFANTGTIEVTGGATAILGGPPDAFGQTPAWSNSGLISLDGGTLVLSGMVNTGQIGHVTSTGGSVILAGTLTNTGATLSLGAGGTLPALTLAGTIQGGAISDPGGLLSVGIAGTALLDGVTDTGTLDLSDAGAWLRIRDGLTLVGEADITGAGAVMGFQGSQVFDKARVDIGNNGQLSTLDVQHDGTVAGGSTLTLGPNLTIVQTGAYAAIGAPTDMAGDAISSFGTITAAVAGGTLSLGGANFANHGHIFIGNGETLALTAGQFSNSGTISIGGGTLAIADTISASALGSLALNNAVVAIRGTLIDGGGTLAIGAGSNWGRLSLTGTISGGTIADSGGGLNAQAGATLTNVAYQGLLDLSRPFQQLALGGGFTIAGIGGSGLGTIMLTGAASRLLSTSTETISSAAIILGSPTQTYLGQHIAPPELAAAANTTLTLGTGATVRDASLVGWLGDYSTGNWTDTIVNDGNILASYPGGILTLGSSFFTNAGSLSIGSGGNALFAGVGMQNTGNISLNAGSSLMVSLLAYYEAPDAGATVFTNSGTIHMYGGVLQELTAGGLFPTVSIVNQAGALIQGLGNIVAPIVNNGLIESKYGPNLSLAGAISGTGTLQLDAGVVMELGGPVASTETVSFTAAGETLRLDNPANFAAHVANFATGDVIDVAGSQLNTVAVTSGTLVLGTTYGQLRLATTAPLGGAFSVGADTHGGDWVGYVQQSGAGGVGGGTITTIGVPQPKMLFWASPVGDIFTGTAANMQGAILANWSTTDSLDFVDMMGTNTRVSYAQASGQGTITVTDGAHTDTIGLLGSYNATWFHVTTDAHLGALVTYSQT